MPRLEVEILSIRPALAELERAVKWAYAITGDRYDCPPVTVTIQKKFKKNQLGCFSPYRWSTKEGGEVHEINVSAEHLFDDPVDIIGTVVHEAVHLNNHDNGVKDVAQGGRHNKNFGALATELGLEAAGPDGKEWNATVLTEDMRSRIETEFKPDYEALALFRTVPEAKKPRKSTRSWHCDALTEDCVKVQVPAKRNLNATCEYCETPFTTDEEVPE